MGGCYQHVVKSCTDLHRNFHKRKNLYDTTEYRCAKGRPLPHTTPTQPKACVWCECTASHHTWKWSKVFICLAAYCEHISKSAQIWPVIARGSHSFTCHPYTNHTCLYSPAAKHHHPLTGTHCAYPQRDGQAELTRVAGYMLRFTPKAEVKWRPLVTSDRVCCRDLLFYNRTDISWTHSWLDRPWRSGRRLRLVISRSSTRLIDYKYTSTCVASSALEHKIVFTPPCKCSAATKWIIVFTTQYSCTDRTRAVD